ncbi:hypothetical protein GGR28_002833 [Lewinella aquimaris]|uniref:Capsule polysaccharide biosynthesis protein n=1 Tax=Neolewinella aquimaris TaxID=1835722 RepID=A0A840E8E5_9BACT|nr:hypothetical protein [Neolewinella aquimaris]MBB4080203.1 hypothetical protein [Neolewinella aquimaris]
MASLVGDVSAELSSERTFWIRDNLGHEQKQSTAQLTIIDHQAALVQDLDALPSVTDGANWTDELLARYASIKPTVLKMQDRLERYGPAVSYTQREATFRKQFVYWLNFLSEYRIDAFIGSNVPHEVVDYVIAEICEVLGIRTLFFYQWTPDLLLPFTSYNTLGDQSTRPAARLTATDRSLLDSINERIAKQQRGIEAARPFYMESGNISRQRQQLERHWSTRAVNKVLTNWRRMFSRSGMNYAKFLLVDKKFLRPRQDRAYVDRYASIAEANPDLTAPYIYLALHYQPEATTSPLGGVFVDQYLMVDVLLAAFPPEVRIYVKEHPAQRLIGRGEQYYDLLAKSPRVHFIATQVSSADLQGSALAVATVTGTVGFESMWKGIPVLAFGHTYYLGGPGVYFIQSVADACRAAAEIQEGVHRKQDAETFTRDLVDRALPANCDSYYHDNSVLGLPVAHNVRVIREEIVARFIAPASPPK